MPALAKRVGILLKKARTVEGYDNPYLAGRSTDMARLYPDRHFPKTIKVKGKTINTRKSTAVHEVTEWVLMQDGHKYQDAHRVANEAEREYVEDQGVDWKSYTAELDNYIKGTEHAKITRVPTDLDLGPFEDEDDRKRLVQLKSRMKHGAA